MSLAIHQLGRCGWFNLFTYPTQMLYSHLLLKGGEFGTTTLYTLHNVWHFLELHNELGGNEMRRERFWVVLVVLILALSALTASLVLADTGGPDAFGYIFIDSQEPNGPAYDWVDIAATGTAYQLGDDESTSALSLGFTFNFYGSDFTSVYADSNGYLSFDAGQDGDFSNACPVAGDVTNFVGAFWDDLDPGDDTASLYHQNFAAGSCPYDGYAGACSVVHYEEFDLFPGDGTPGGTFGTFEAILLDNNSVIYQYEDVSDTGTSASIGIGNGTGSIELMYGCNAAGTIANGRSVLFAALSPEIVVDPAAVASVQEPDTVATVPMSITNNGDLGLTWEILEQIPLNPVPASPSGVPERLQGAPGAPNNAVPTAPLAEQIQDGSFEAGTPNPYWTESSTNFGSPLCTVAGCGTGQGTGPRSGTWWTWFGGAIAYEEGSMSQVVTIPVGATVLTWWQENFACSGSATDYMEVNVDGTQVYQILGNDASCGVLGYTQKSVDISAYADGNTHTIEFHSETFTATPTNFFVDDVSLFANVAGDCVSTDEVPWLTASPLNGTTAIGGTDVVDLTFDATGYVDGVYTGTLCIATNDPDALEVLVPVTMTVATQPTDVTLSTFSGSNPINLVPVGLGVVLALVGVVGFVLRRKMTA